MLARAEESWAAASVRRMRRSGGHLELVVGDLLELDLGPRFALVILALNSLLLLADERRQAAALAAMARHLRPGGTAVVDVWLPTPEDLVLYDGRLVLEWLRRDPETGDDVAKLASASYEPAMGRVELRVLFDATPPGGGTPRRTTRLDHLRLVSASELVRFGRDAGLAIERVEELAGDYQLGPFGPFAERAVLVTALL